MKFGNRIEDYYSGKWKATKWKAERSDVPMKNESGCIEMTGFYKNTIVESAKCDSCASNNACALIDIYLINIQYLHVIKEF